MLGFLASEVHYSIWSIRCVPFTIWNALCKMKHMRVIATENMILLIVKDIILSVLLFPSLLYFPCFSLPVVEEGFDDNCK